MNRKRIHLALLLIFLAATAFVVLRYKASEGGKPTAFYPLKERTGSLAGLPEWALIKERGNRLIRLVRETPADKKSALALATLYIQEGRATGDFAHYNPAATHYAETVLQKEPENFEALVLKAVVQLSDHHFLEGLQTAEKAQGLNPYNAYVWGLITDANVELGRYDAAVQSLEKMVAIRPDLRSYSRIAYLREIYGDTAGALVAMQEAVKAGLPGEEATEWARVQLAGLYERTGNVAAAEQQYRTALAGRPDYAYAHAGLGNLAAARADYRQAIGHYKKAIAVLNDGAFRESLARVYQLAGEKEQAAGLINAMVDELNEAAAKGEGATAHHADLELAWAYDLKGDGDKALAHAMKEYNGRPDNIDAAEAAAWAHYKKGDAAAALPYLQKALRTGSKNPALLCRAGFIYKAAGEEAKGKDWLRQGLQTDPVMDPLLKRAAVAALHHQP